MPWIFAEGPSASIERRGGLCSQVSHGPHPTLAPTGSEIPTKRGYPARGLGTTVVDTQGKEWGSRCYPTDTKMLRYGGRRTGSCQIQRAAQAVAAEEKVSSETAKLPATACTRVTVEDTLG